MPREIKELGMYERIGQQLEIVINSFDLYNRHKGQDEKKEVFGFKK